MIEKIQDIGEVPSFYSTQVLKAHRFYFDVHAREHHGLTVVCGGSEHCEPDFCIDREDLPFYSIEYVARGRGELVLKGKTFPLVAGAVFAYGPDIPHVITSDPKDRLVKYFVDFQGPRALPLLDTYAPHPGEVVRAIFRAPSRRPMAYRQTPFDTDDNPSRQRPGETGRRI